MRVGGQGRGLRQTKKGNIMKTTKIGKRETSGVGLSGHCLLDWNLLEELTTKRWKLFHRIVIRILLHVKQLISIRIGGGSFKLFVIPHKNSNVYSLWWQGKIKPTGEKMIQSFFDCEKSTEKKTPQFWEKKKFRWTYTPHRMRGEKKYLNDRLKFRSLAFLCQKARYISNEKKKSSGGKQTVKQLPFHAYATHMVKKRANTQCKMVAKWNTCWVANKLLER